MEPPDLKGMTRRELEGFAQALGERTFRGRQIMRWLYHRGTEDFSQMTDLPKTLRVELSRRARISRLELLAEETSQDGTRKFLFGLEDGQAVESVLIPEGDRLTLCVSTQVGCAMGCRFCLTARAGFSRNLRAAEIVDQALQVRRLLPTSRRITNVVLMGMGEPLANYQEVVRAIEVMEDDLGLGLSARRITLSTVGLLPELQRLFADGVRCRLAISLNASDQETRQELMPISRKYPLEELLEVCRRLPLPPRERITFEYVLIAGVNSSREDAHRLASILRGVRCKVNLIPLNEAPEIPYRAPSPDEVLAFQKVLLDAGYTALVRESRGTDISAACGQLRGRVFEERRSC